MSRRIFHGGRSRTSVPPDLLHALETLYGPLTKPETVARIARGLEKLHRGLTRERSRFVGRRYLRDPDMRLAYSTYMVCAQAPKLMALLDRIGSLPKGDSPLRVLELGSGPGTGIAAFGLTARALGRDYEYVATDRVAEALEAAEALSNTLSLKSVEFVKVDLSRAIARQLDDGDPFDIILCMNVLNELPEDRLGLLVREFNRWVTDGGRVIIIEPAALEPSRRILEFRERCIAGDWPVLAPCPHQLECPALESERDWCHDTWAFERPEFMAKVDEIVGTRRESLKATWFVLGRTGNEGDAGCTGNEDDAHERLGRVVSERFQEKGRSHAKVCTADGLITLELQTRDVTAENAAFADAGRYDLLQYYGARNAGRRLRLGKDSRCVRIEESNLLDEDSSASDHSSDGG